MPPRRVLQTIFGEIVEIVAHALTLHECFVQIKYHVGYRRPGRQLQAYRRGSRPVHQQIGIAPDRGGEMGVALQGQTEMTEIQGIATRRRLDDR